MALSAADRKNLSKKYVTIPTDNATAATNITNLNNAIADFQAKDASYKSLFDSDNAIVNLYHPEINKLAGHDRTSIVEQDIQDSANKVTGNFFFPNNAQVPTPGLSDGLWKQLKAYAKNKAVGKNYQESYGTSASETSLMTAVTTMITSITTNYTSTERQTGTQAAPPPPDITQDIVTLKNKVTDWKTNLNAQKTALLANTDTVGAANIATALTNVNNTLAQITSWEALADFATNGKLSNSGLAILNTEITSRTSTVTTRISEINTRLGDITQNADGSLAAFSGLYGARYFNIDSRINLADGTLSKQKGLELGKRVQQETISNNNSYLTYLQSSVLIATKLTANATNTSTVTVDNVTGLSVSNTVYIVSETQSEISGTIIGISGLTVTLSFNVPTTFTISDLARLIKEV